jgi:pimeloyl-ACP methyl ester carboxylesterase
VRATREQCVGLDDAVWADAGESGSECLRYWKAGFPDGGSRRAIVYFAGDVWLGAGRVEKAYLGTSIEGLRRSAAIWAKNLEAPYIFFARPGTFGSSGDHMQRRRVAESKLITAALDRLKEKLKIDEFVVVGQSGGGHVVSSLLTWRDDIVCAVPTSAVSSPRIRWRMKGATRDATGYSDSYEPAERLDKRLAHPKLRVFVLGNPEDTNVVWPAQQIMADKARRGGHRSGGAARRRDRARAPFVAGFGRVVAGWCYHDISTGEIVRRAAKGLRG